jgi:hypothetical protein
VELKAAQKRLTAERSREHGMIAKRNKTGAQKHCEKVVNLANKHIMPIGRKRKRI